MRKTPKDDQLSYEEAARIRDAAILRALNTPPKHHSEMKLGKGKAKPSGKSANESKTRPASKGRVHKGRTRT